MYKSLEFDKIFLTDFWAIRLFSQQWYKSISAARETISLEFEQRLSALLTEDKNVSRLIKLILIPCLLSHSSVPAKFSKYLSVSIHCPTGAWVTPALINTITSTNQRPTLGNKLGNYTLFLNVGQDRDCAHFPRRRKR